MNIINLELSLCVDPLVARGFHESPASSFLCASLRVVAFSTREELQKIWLLAMAI